VSVVVPAYDEQGRIEDSLLKIKAYMQDAGLGFEIVVVDDGSRDRTPEIVAEFARNDPRIKLVQNRRNLGKGAAVRNGVRSSRGDVVLFSDADLSTPIQEFENLLAWIDSHELVIASRSLPDSKVLVHQPFYREMMGRTYNVFVRTLLVRGLIDTQCGFKLMTRRAADAIFRLQRILIARKMGYSVKEVPVQWVNSRASKVHPVLDSVQMLLDLFRIKFYDISGFYGKRVERE